MRWLLSLLLGFLSVDAGAQEAGSRPEERVWVGPATWANRLADWRGGPGLPLRCVEGRLRFPFRTLMCLDQALAPASGSTRLALDLLPSVKGERQPTEAAAGMLLGAGGPNVDYRRSAQVHQTPGPDGGLLVLVSSAGRLQVLDFSGAADKGHWTMSNSTRLADLPVLGESGAMDPGALKAGGRLTVEVVAEGTEALLVATYGSMEVTVSGLPTTSVDGLFGVVSHGAAGGAGDGFSFSGPARAMGAGMIRTPERAFGPVLATQYTVSNQTLKLVAQLPVLPAGVGLHWELCDGEQVLGYATRQSDAHVVSFRVSGWVPNREATLHVRGELDGQVHLSKPIVVRAEPSERRALRLAALSCVKSYTGRLQWNEQGLWFPHEDLVENTFRAHPDLLFFAGDQIYEGDLTPAITSPLQDAMLDYHMKWWRWCWAFGELTRQFPTITIPDDHDVYHGNVWGNAGLLGEAPAGRKLSAQDLGGYKMGPRFVNMVHATQVQHLPDPVDPEPLDNGISVYHTALDWGAGSFAILADRMWKPSPSVAVPAGEIVNGWPRAEGFDAVRDGDPEGTALLGERQQRFLDAWTAEWREGAQFKGVLSQTIFANLATLPAEARHDGVVPSLRHAAPGEFIEGDVRAADGDSNGWPRTGRDLAVRAMQRGYAFHVAGDQHLSTVSQYGLDAPGDASFAFCVPAVANTFPRRWFPEVDGAGRGDGAPRTHGDFRDGWGNLVTVHAVANPTKQGREPALLHDRMPGYGLIDMDPQSGEVVFTAWPRYADSSDVEARPYPGWPVRFHVHEQGPEVHAYLAPIPPNLGQDPLVRVREVGGDTLYTVRLQGLAPRPWVFGPGRYEVLAGRDSDHLTRVGGEVVVE